MDTASPRVRRTIAPATLQDEIQSCLRTAGAGASGGTAGRETFASIAEQVVRHLEERGYRITASSSPPAEPDRSGQ